MRHVAPTASLLAALFLSACGGGDPAGDAATANAADTDPASTTLLAAPAPVAVTQADGSSTMRVQPRALSALLGKAAGMADAAGPPRCAFRVYRIRYSTVGGQGEPTDAVTAVMVPDGDDPACAGPRPVLLYAHGTSVEQAYSMADLRNPEALLLAAMFAAQGYLVVAPSYAGYDGSSLAYHPYMNAAQQSRDMSDGLRAARKAFPLLGASASDRLVLAGYSQGGHVAMATQRAMQQDPRREFTVTALAGMSGPYATALFGDTVFAGSPNLGGTIFLPLLTTSWQKAYGGLYATPGDAYEAAYADGIESLLPSATYMYSTLISSGRLPEKALFAADSLPGPSAPAFAQFFGAGNLIRSRYRDAYVADLQEHPCGTRAANPLACAPAHALRKAGLKNDLRTYVPDVPVMLCGGSGDPTVFYAGTQATASYFLLNGMPAARLVVLDVDSLPLGAGDPYAAEKLGFAAAKGAAAKAAAALNADPDEAVANAYHGVLVPPFCNAAARRFFAGAMAR